MIRSLSNSKQRGFTLIEAVVAAGVFAFVVSSSLAVYLATIQLDSKSRSERAVQQNARFIMDFLSKEVRNGSIDYSGTNNSTTLSLINQLDQAESITFDSAAQVLNLTKAGLGTTSLSSDDVRVVAASFAVYPSSNPFVLANDVHVQPHVTVTLQLASVNLKASESATMNIQSTFVVREYPSRQ